MLEIIYHQTKAALVCRDLKVASWMKAVGDTRLWERNSQWSVDEPLFLSLALCACYAVLTKNIPLRHPKERALLRCSVNISRVFVASPNSGSPRSSSAL
jgi:hypothetical protein